LYDEAQILYLATLLFKTALPFEISPSFNEKIIDQQGSKNKKIKIKNEGIQ